MPPSSATTPPPSAAAATSPTASHPTRWSRWALALLIGGALLVWAALTFGLDPWLQHTLEEKVRTASHGRYRLRLGGLRTNLRLRRLDIRDAYLTTPTSSTTSSAADSLPPATVALRHLRLQGVGLWEALRGQEIPVDVLRLDSLAVVLDRLPTGVGGSGSLHKSLPGAGLRLGHLVVRHLHGRVGPVARPQGQLSHANLTIRDLRLSAAGATDSARLGYAAAVAGRVRGLRVRVPGHRLALGGLWFSSDARQLMLDSLAVHPYQPISPQRSASMRLRLVLPRLVLSGLDGAALARRRFRADTLGLYRPQVALVLPATAPPPFHELLAPYLRECRLAALLSSGGQLQVAGLEEAPLAQAVGISASDVRVLPYPGKPAARIYYARAWQVRTGLAMGALNPPYYHMQWRSLRADTRRGQLAVRQVLLVPTMSVAALSRAKGHQAAHLTVRIPGVAFTGLQFEAAANRQALRARALTIVRPRISTRSDGRFPQNPAVSHITPEALMRVPFQIALDRLRIEQATITAQYRAPRNPQPGIIQIDDFTGTLRNISNDPARMSAAHPLTGTARGRLQGQCRAQIQLRANVLDPAGRHTLSGTFYAAPLSILNPMTVPTRGIRFRSGTIQRIDFQMRLDQQAARGTMRAPYADLKLQRLNRQNEPGLLHRLQTSAINGLFIRDDNPRKPGQELKTGSMYSARERRYSVFTLWRQGLVSGLLNSAGVPAPLAKKLSEGK